MTNRDHCLNKPLALFGLAVPLLAAGCGAGVAGVAASSGGSSSGNSAASIANLQVPVSRTSPARIHFELSDREGETVRVELCARVPLPGGGLSAAELLTQVSGPGFPANGAAVAIPAGSQIKAIDADWRFSDESFLPNDGRFVEGIQLVARLSTGAELVLGDDEPLSIGNDAPLVTAVTPIIDPQEGEAAGIMRVEVTVEDSSDDVVTVVPEFDVQGDVPDEGWKTATGFGLSNVRVSRDGTTLDFFWDTDTDLHDLERQVALRFTATDFALVGPALASVAFRVDNNAAPIVQLDSGPLILNPDERRGIPIPFRVIDEEGDLVEVIFQWRREGEEFPQLPTDMAALDAILADKVVRQEHHVCTPYPHYAKGRVVPIDENTVRLPELASSESWILASGIVGRTLELLRPSSIPSPITPTWRSNPLVSPIAALPVGDGLTAIVLDVSGNGRLREIELATGEVVPRKGRDEIATFGQGTPSAMAFERGEKAVLVALDDAGAWRIERVELASGALRELVVSDGTEPAPVRGIASLGTNALVFTAGTSLYHLDYRDSLAPQLGRLLTDLATPWGVVVDPLPPDRIYLSERDANRVLAIELDSHGKFPVVVKTAEMQLGTLDAPESLAIERHGSRMLIVTSAPGGGRQLLGLDLGATGRNVSFPIGAPSGVDVASVATGPEGLRLLCLPSSNEILVAGGIEQRRVIAAHSTSSQDVSVERHFDPVPSPGQPGCLPEEAHRLVRASAQGVVRLFVWDSADAITGSVFVRAMARDDEVGVAADGAAPKRVRGGLETEPLALGGLGVTRDPRSVVAADLDGDGDQDLCSANFEGQNLTVFFQQFPVSFSGSPLSLGGFPVTERPVSVAAADLDGDGDEDLVSANQFGDNLTVFFQLLPGSFSASPLELGRSGVTSDPSSVAVADLDGDGDQDLVSANEFGDDLTVFFQLLPGSFSASPLALGGSGVMDYPVSVGAADLDGDGDQDLVSANRDGNNLTVFLQTSSGSYSVSPIALGGPEVTYRPLSVEAADLDGDGDQDLVSANEFGDDLTVFFQLSPGSFSASPLVLGGSGVTEFPSSVAAADLDGDGDQDLVSANEFGDDLAVFFQLHAGSFWASPLALGGSGITTFPVSVVARDLDGDGDQDLASANARGSNLTVFFHRSPGIFSASPLALGGPGVTDRPSSVAAADLDGDGDQDLVSANGVGSNLSVFLQHSPGSFSASPVALGGQDVTSSPSSVAAADLDGDGDQDLVSANPDDLGFGGDNLTVFFQLFPGGFSASPLALGGSGVTDRPSWVAAADLDGDGDQDLVSANFGGDNLTIFFQQLPGSFSASPLVLGGSGVTTFPVSVVAADLDGDGDQDLVSTNPDLFGGGGDNLTVFFQLFPGSFSASPHLVGGPGVTPFPVSVAAADLDADGDQDLVSANDRGNNLTVFFQRFPGSFSASPLVLGGSGVTDPHSVAAADLDGDGDKDLVSANEDGSDLKVFIQLSPGVFSAVPLALGGPEVTRDPDSIAAVDIDGDGEQDLVSANLEGNNLTVFFGGR